MHYYKYNSQSTFLNHGCAKTSSGPLNPNLFIGFLYII